MTFLDRSITRSILPALALLAITVGAYRPWIRPNPERRGETDVIPDILLPKMNSGLEAYSVLLLGLVLAALAILVFERTARRRSLATVVVGSVTVLVAIQYLRSTSLAGFDSTFVPTDGWYVTVAGGILLVIAGLVLRLSTDPNPDPDPDHEPADEPTAESTN
ncbi:hypothetical protein [Natronoglomus mannanivorans]|uniref:Uncharacterized protein n=1 Tax=Natronoglomus mannanivorans TaxID=2979990 RepID=A0AAP3E3R1_9EURY|nr:hypothetical protein [Halobacteria archaeon AArc-xg1-1]